VPLYRVISNAVCVLQVHPGPEGPVGVVRAVPG